MRPNAYEVSLFLRYHLIIAILFSAATYCSPSTDFSSRVQVRVFLSLSGCELKYPKTSWRVRFFYSISQLLYHGLSYLPYASSLPLHLPLPCGGGGGTGRAGGRRTGCWLLGCLLPPPQPRHRCRRSPARANGSATRQVSCSSCYLLRCHRLKSRLPARCSPILLDTTGGPRESWGGLAAVPTPLLQHCLACDLTPTKSKLIALSATRQPGPHQAGLQSPKHLFAQKESIFKHQLLMTSQKTLTEVPLAKAMRKSSPALGIR